MIGGLPVGEGSPLRIQGMLKSPLDEPEKILEEGRRLVEAGAEIIRAAVPGEDSAAVYGALSELGVPLVADCHFSPGIAASALKAGFDKVRVNPGNTPEKGVLETAEAAARRSAALRLGFNSGSCGAHGSEELASLALEWDDKLRKRGFENFLVSMKSPSVTATVDANRFFSMRSDTPLHIGVTATGPPREGIIKTSAALGALLVDGVGDTIRVSLTDESVEEVRTAVILRNAVFGYGDALEVISCPGCSRSRIDVSSWLDTLISELAPEDREKPLSIAVMGCEVNGPGEASHCDIGICGTRNGALIIRKGKALKTAESGEKEMIRMLIREFRKL